MKAVLHHQWYRLVISIFFIPNLASMHHIPPQKTSADFSIWLVNDITAESVPLDTFVTTLCKQALLWHKHTRAATEQRAPLPEVYKAFLDQPIGQTYAIHLAVTHGSLEKIQALLDFWVNVTVADAHGYTPLGLALKLKKEAVAFLLLQDRRIQETINTRNPQGYTPLQVVCFNKQLALIRALLKLGADHTISTMVNGLCVTPGSIACKKDFGLLFETLLLDPDVILPLDPELLEDDDESLQGLSPSTLSSTSSQKESCIYFCNRALNEAKEARDVLEQKHRKDMEAIERFRAASRAIENDLERKIKHFQALQGTLNPDFTDDDDEALPELIGCDQ